LLGPTRNTITAGEDPSPGPEAALLRIFAQRREDEIVLWADLVDGPAEGDAVVEVGGSLVFLDAAAAAGLADWTLAARVSDGRVHLVSNGDS
jgi:hypothetical protein